MSRWLLWPMRIPSINEMVEFHIRLEKGEYNAGETVNGVFEISLDHRLKLNHVKFYVEGIEHCNEATSIRVMKSAQKVVDVFGSKYGISGGEIGSTKASNTIFSEDLSDSLQSSGLKISYEDEVELEKGQWDIPFHFTIPSYVLESYEGKHTKIIDKIIVSTGQGKLDLHRHFHKEQPFRVLTPHYNEDIDVKTILFDGEPVILDSEAQEYEKDGFKVEIEIEDNKFSFSPGETIGGRIALKDLTIYNKGVVASASGAENDGGDKVNIKKAEITLSAIENSIYLQKPLKSITK